MQVGSCSKGFATGSGLTRKRCDRDGVTELCDVMALHRDGRSKNNIDGQISVCIGYLSYDLLS